tara:strand:- start:1926 stop:3302 length:1377 start_codon:yes stop_codon:yes gene_type:complete
MIKLIVFDLDGVLVNARELHYEALNRSLKEIDPKYMIELEEHLSTFDGLPTSKKLNMLTKMKCLPVDSHNVVWKNKQKHTINIISNEYGRDDRICNLLRDLKEEGFKIAVASNSIRETIKMVLLRKGFMEYIDFFYSNQDVKNSKPNPEIYLKCMIKAEVGPQETVVVEDSHIGREAAQRAGAHVCGVMNSEEVTREKIFGFIEKNKPKTLTRPKWQGGNMKVLIPMAGEGSRFQKAGYSFPKPLIEVNGKPMIQLVVENLNIDAQHIFVVRKEHEERYNIKHLLQLISPGCEVILTDGLTEGAACTTLLAKEFINNDEALLYANSDQFLEWDSNEFMYSMMADSIDGGMLTFEATHPKWSFAKLGEDGYVNEVAEKKPISNIATTGIYYWKHGSDYVKYAEQMIENNVRVNNEFYVCPVFNEAIADNKKIKIFPTEKMWGIGTPEDLDTFLRNYKGS